MIFLARGLVVCLAFFGVMYCTLSCAVTLIWRATERVWRNSAQGSPRFLFVLRIFSFAASALVTVFFIFPSFWMMERPSLDEDATTFILAGCALLILIVGFVRAYKANARTNNAVTEWLEKPSIGGGESPSMSAAKGAPALMLVGIRRPRVMVSDMAAALLSESELQVAIRHELGHSRSWDNLKKVLISATPFPGMRPLERAWRESAELAADEAAVDNRQEALDLAAALIKLSRPASHWSEPALASGLVCSSSSITTRVQRLVEWRAKARSAQDTRFIIILAIFLAVGGIASHYGSTLVLTHRLTELLVP